MKRITLILIILSSYQFSFSQRLDLIVRINGDSIVCKIDSISSSHIYFEVINSDKWVSVDLSKNLVKEFKYDIINPDFYDFKPRTSSIKAKRKYPSYTPQNAECASLEELDLYLIRAMKMKKNGAILSIAGPLSTIAGLLMFAASWSGDFGGSFTAGLGGIMFFAGAGVSIVGVPILITGASRVKKIEGIINSKNTGMFIELASFSFYNPIVQNHQPGITLRLRF